MSNRRYIFDIEGDNLVVEATKIWLAVAIDADSGQEHRFDRTQLTEFADLLVNANELIGHNIIGYDIPVCERLLGITIKAKLTDTLITSRMMYPDRFNKKNPIRSHSLSSWGEALGHPKIDFAQIMVDKAKERTPKSEWSDLLVWKKTNPFKCPPNDTVSEEEWLSEMMTYCAQDVVVNDQTYRKQLPWMEANEKPLRMEHIASTICTQQVLNGWGFDPEAGEQLEQELMMDKAGALDVLRQAFPTIVERRWSDKRKDKEGNWVELKPKVTEFNPGSHAQVYSRLNDKYNGAFNPPMTEEGNPQCDTEVLSKYARNMPECAQIIQFRDIAKLEGQVKKWNVLAHASQTGRIHGQINVQGAQTGRCTHSGPNMAQVASDARARSLWVPLEPGHVVLGADLSGLELRALAHYMGEYDEGAYAREILTGDIHTANQKAAGLPTRNDAKTFIYAFLYGAGDGKIGQIVGGGRTAGAQLKKDFLTKLPALKRLIDHTTSEATRFKSVTLPDGRRVPVRSEHAALNTLLQGAGAIISKYWMIVANKNLTKKYGDNVVKQMAYVHDELQFSCPADIAEEAGQLVIDAAVEAGKRLHINMRIDAEFAIGKNWSETH